MGMHDEALVKFQQENPDIIMALFAPSSFGDFLKKEMSENGKSGVFATNYRPTIYDSTMIVQVLFATLLVAIGAWYASDEERTKMYHSSTNRMDVPSRRLRKKQEVEELDQDAAWSFVITASCALLVMYFFVGYIFYVVLLMFCLGATNGLSTVFSHFVDFLAPSLQIKYFSIKSITFSASDLLGFVPAAAITVNWYLFRLTDWGWILQNTMCVGLLLVLQRTVRISNMQIATILLSMAFLYDIFWVFLSPMFFESSPMIKVATYQHSVDPRDTLPVVLKFPRIDDPFHHPMVLGLGDIALPGLFVSYLLRFDYLSRVGMSLRTGYFVPAVIGYMVGMGMTDINLILMRSGQPALLFLVPCTLGLTCVLGWWRGEFNALWKGNALKQKSHSKVSKSADFAVERESLLATTRVGGPMSV